MKTIFEQLEAEVDQNVVNRKHDEIERKNILIANDYLIANCLYKEVFIIATNSEFTVSRFTEMHDAHTVVQARCLELEAELSKLTDKIQKDDHNELVKLFSNLEATRAKHIDQTIALLTENKNLKARINEKMKCVTIDSITSKVLAPGMYAINVAPLPSGCRNNREVHLDYLKHLKESVTTLREIELLEYAVGTCLKDFNKRDNKYAFTSLTRNKQVTFEDQCVTLNNNTHKHVEKLNIQKTNAPVIPSTRVNSYADASESKLRSNTKKNRISLAKSVNKKKVEEHPKTIKSSLNHTNHVNSSISSRRTVINSNSSSICKTCNKSLTSANHDMRVVNYLHSVNASSYVKNVVRKVTVISRVYYVEGLGHNLFSVGQFCDSDLEVAFKKHSCYVRDTNGVELIKGSRGFNLYTISVEDMLKSSPICLLSKASKNKSWLWHRHLNHLNFGTINDLARKYLVRGLPRLKFEKDHFFSVCQLGKSKKHTHQPKAENTNLEVLNTLYMDLCGPMRVQTINGKKYILVIVDDYSRFTWVEFLRLKDETPEFVSKFLEQIQVILNKIQNGVVERQNRTLMEAARTMLIFSKAPMFLWAAAVATACYTQNRSLIHSRHNKTQYELVHDKKPDLTFLRFFGALFYPINDSEDIGILQPTADIGIFVGYAPSRIAPYVPPTNKELEILFQPMFDEYLESPHVERLVSPATAVQVPVFSAGTPSSTTIDQDASSPSHSSSKLQPPISVDW
nr:Gag-Pol polyprotein [Tanacetum cinerariifolium]